MITRNLSMHLETGGKAAAQGRATLEAGATHLHENKVR
jgi:hypothetical protein